MLRKFKNFTDAFRHYYDEAWRDGVEGAQGFWDAETFGTALKKASLGQESNKVVGSLVSRTAIDNWLAGGSGVAARNLKLILLVFFGRKPKDPHALLLTELWKAQHEFGPKHIVDDDFWSQISEMFDKPTDGVEPTPPHLAENFSRSLDDWDISSAINPSDNPDYTMGLFGIYIFKHQGDSQRDFKVLISLSPSVRTDPIDGYMFKWGLSRYEITEECEGCGPIPKSVTKNPLIQKRGRVYHFLSLIGDIITEDYLHDEPLVRMQHDGKADVIKINYTARCLSTDIVLVPNDAPETISEKHKKMMKQWSLKSTRGKNGYVYLGSGQIIWSRPDETSQ